MVKSSTRFLYQSLAWVCVALGFIGAFLPVMPTTIFLIIAAWAFSKSSDYWHQWLLNHSIFGKTLTAWEEHHAMPKRAKRIAFISLIISYSITAYIWGPLSFAAIFCGICLFGVAIYIAHIPVLITSEIEQSSNKVTN